MSPVSKFEYIGNSLKKGPVGGLNCVFGRLGRLACEKLVHDVYNAVLVGVFRAGKVLGDSPSMCPLLDSGDHCLQPGQFKCVGDIRARQPSNYPSRTLKDETPQSELRRPVDLVTLVGANDVCPKPESSIGGSREGFPVAPENSNSRVLNMLASMSTQPDKQAAANSDWEGEKFVPGSAAPVTIRRRDSKAR